MVDNAVIISGLPLTKTALAGKKFQLHRMSATGVVVETETGEGG